MFSSILIVMGFLKYLEGGCKNCVEVKRENDELKKVTVQHVISLEAYFAFVSSQRVEELENALKKLEVGHKPPSKRSASPLVSPVIEKIPRSEKRREEYAVAHSQFDNSQGYTQIQGKANQANVDVLVHHVKLRVTGSYGRSCLCCSLMFHASLVTHSQKKIELYTAEWIEQVTMRGECCKKKYFCCLLELVFSHFRTEHGFHCQADR